MVFEQFSAGDSSRYMFLDEAHLNEAAFCSIDQELTRPSKGTK